MEGRGGGHLRHSGHQVGGRQKHQIQRRGARKVRPAQGTGHHAAAGRPPQCGHPAWMLHRTRFAKIEDILRINLKKCDFSFALHLALQSFSIFN